MASVQGFTFQLLSTLALFQALNNFTHRTRLMNKGQVEHKFCCKCKVV